MPGILFPEADRVVYARSPLVNVICQVRFPADLRMETEPPVAFQQRVRSEFPILAQKTRSFISALPAEITRAFESVLPRVSEGTIWTFSTEDGTKSLELTKEHLTIASRAYRHWEDFYGSFQEPLKALAEIYRPAFFTRIGLRYQDVIRRSEVGLTGVGWWELLQPHALGELAFSEVRERVDEISHTAMIGLPEYDAKLRLQHGFAQVEGSSEEGYLIDGDFFANRTDLGREHDTINYFHDNAFRLFRWCITDRLHRALEPRAPGG